MPSHIEVQPTAAAVAQVAATYFIRAAAGAISARDRFIVALSGGTTPRKMLQQLAAEPLATQVQWSKVAVIWGDERCVPSDHSESNYRMARETLLDHVPIPASHIHRIPGEDDPAVAASHYQSLLRALFNTPAGAPRTTAGARIDLALLGLGDDGHTASLFPGSAALHDNGAWAVTTYSNATATWRVTLTPAVLNAAAEVLFIVTGASKADVARRVLEGPFNPDQLPAQVIKPSHGRLRWLLDAAAAADLKSVL